MVSILKKTPGNATLAVDGVTVLGESHLLYTLSKGVTTVFMKSSKLGSLVHAMDAEIVDGVDNIEHANEKYEATVTNIAVYNAARHVIQLVITAYSEKHPDDSPIVATRDPEHCVDLLAKDSAKTATMADILDKATKVISFSKLTALLVFCGS